MLCQWNPRHVPELDVGFKTGDAGYSHGIRKNQMVMVRLVVMVMIADGDGGCR